MTARTFAFGQAGDQNQAQLRMRKGSPMTETALQPKWHDDRTFDLGGVSFQLRIAARFRSQPDNFILVKHRHMVDRYVELLHRLAPRRMLELGILEGGSVALAALLARPDRFLAIDLKQDPTEPLETFIDAHGLRDRVRTRYGVDQADRTRLRAVVEQELGSEPLDLVVDDASHELHATRASFEVLFPRLRDGGVFVIEDWSSDHHVEAVLDARMSEDPSASEALATILREAPPPPPSLTAIVFELILASAFHRDIVREVFVADDWAYAVRGPAVVDADTFALSDLYGEGAARLLPEAG